MINIFVRESILEVRILSWFLKVLFIVRSFSGLAAPPVRSAGRGRAQQRRGAHSTCKLILEMCASFLILNLLNPHMLYIYDYHYHHYENLYACLIMLSKWGMRYWYVIRMHDTMMIKIYTGIFIVLLRKFQFHIYI